MAPLTPALVVGCGYLGRRVARAWQSAGRPVFATTRSRAAEFRAAGFTPITADVMNPTSLEALRDLPPLGTVLWAVGWDRQSGHTLRDVYVHGLANLLAKLPPTDRVILISSTSVYAQTGGAWVDASSPTEPTEANGQAVLAAEQAARSVRPDATILRFAGIYGPGRLLRERQVRAGEPYTSPPDVHLNLIHVDDGVQAVLAAETHAAHGSTLVVSDGTPVTRREFYTTLAEVLHAPPAQFTGGAPPAGEPNRRVRPWAGFTPRFANWRDGLTHAHQSGGSSTDG